MTFAEEICTAVTTEGDPTSLLSTPLEGGGDTDERRFLLVESVTPELIIVGPLVRRLGA